MCSIIYIFEDGLFQTQISFLMFDAGRVFLCSNVQTIDFCVSVTNQAE